MQGKCPHCGHFQEVDENDAITVCEECSKMKQTDEWINFAKGDIG